MEAATPASGFAWPGLPYPALITAAGIACLTALVLVASHFFDASGGLLTLSLAIVLAFIAVSLASMIYAVPQTPLTEILIGSLATSMGAIVAFWMSRRKGD
jgi:hypothetical protein